MDLRLAWAHVRHELRRRFRPSPPASAEEVVTALAEDRLRPLSTQERGGLPAMSRCVSCGLCALVVRRLGHVRPPDLANAYLRDLTLLPPAVADLPGGADARRQALEAATAVCPVGVPLDQVAAAVRRLAGAE